MNRRTMFRASLAFSSTLLLPPLAGAQQSTPTVAAEPIYISDLVNIRGVERVVVRDATAAGSGFDMMIAGDLYYVDSWGFLFDTEAHARFLHTQLAHGYEEWMEQVREFRVYDLQEASARSMGDDSWGWVAAFSTEDDDDREYPWALFAVRIETTVQVLVAAAATGSPLTRLADIAEKTAGRWPNDDRRVTLDGQFAGGIWDVVPRLDEFEEGMIIDASNDVTYAFD